MPGLHVAIVKSIEGEDVRLATLHNLRFYARLIDALATERA